MKTVLVDTNIVSFIVKGDTRALLYESHLAGQEKILSFMSYAELHRWLIKWNWKTLRLKRLAHYLDDNYSVHYADEVLCKKWAEVQEQCRRKGRSIDSNDAWIAATALVLELPLITHNKKHFEQVDGLELISEVQET